MTDCHDQSTDGKQRKVFDFFFHNIYDSPLYFIRIIVTRAVWKCQRGYLTVYKLFDCL